MEAWGADGRDGPESHVNYGREVPATVSKMFVLQLMAPCREEDGIFYQGEAARKGGCSAVCAGHLVGEGQTRIAGAIHCKHRGMQLKSPAGSASRCPPGYPA